MTHDHLKVAEGGAYLSAGVAAVSLSQAAYALTIIATLLSIILALVRLHDRVRYGPASRGRE